MVNDIFHFSCLFYPSNENPRGWMVKLQTFISEAERKQRTVYDDDNNNNKNHIKDVDVDGRKTPSTQQALQRGYNVWMRTMRISMCIACAHTYRSQHTYAPARRFTVCVTECKRIVNHRDAVHDVPRTAMYDRASVQHTYPTTTLRDINII